MTFDPQKPTALIIGRFQPFHDGHKAMVLEGLRRVGQVCIAVRCTYGLDGKNPFPFRTVRKRIEAMLADHAGRFNIIHLPNITDVFYGRDVGYNIERIKLDKATEEISATSQRRKMESCP
jgi:nicotinamide mononucleotide adenylyltransferase